MFSSPEHFRIERVSLDWDDETMAVYYDRVKKGNPLRLHILAAEDPAATSADEHQVGVAPRLAAAQSLHQRANDRVHARVSFAGIQREHPLYDLRQGGGHVGGAR